MMEIQIHRLKAKPKLNEQTLGKIIETVSKRLALNAKSITVVFVDDSTLREMHARYLNDSSRTDVMTFDLGEDAVEGEIYISLDRAADQAEQYGVTVEQEIIRLTIHGLLHLKGYDDQTDSDRKEMKSIENALVEQYGNLHN